MSNRKARRAVASNEAGVPDIPLRRPDSKKTTSAQTLYEIAAQRQAELSKDGSSHIDSEVEIIYTKVNPDGSLSEPRLSNDSFTGYLATVTLYAISLTMVHFTFDVFVHQQYRQEIGWDMIGQKTATAFPVLLLLVYVCHTKASTLWMQLALLVGGAAAGCYIVHSSNRYSYYAVMQRTPPLGTLWIWCILELEAVYAAISVAFVGTFFVLGGYTF